MFNHGYGVAMHRRVLAVLTDGSAIEGVLRKRTGDVLVMSNVRLLEQGEDPTPVDGDVLVEVDRVRFTQVP